MNFKKDKSRNRRGSNGNNILVVKAVEITERVEHVDLRNFAEREFITQEKKIRDLVELEVALHWNPEVNMSKEEIDYFLGEKGLIARLSTNGNDGFPNVAPVWYYWDGESIFFDLGVNRANTRNLRRNPRCAVVIDVDKRPVMGMRENFARAVLIRGVAELYDHRARQDEVFNMGGSNVKYSEISGKIDRRYLINPKEDGRLYEKLVSCASPTFHPQLQGEGDRVLVRVKPKSIKAWDFSKAPWSE